MVNQNIFNKPFRVRDECLLLHSFCQRGNDEGGGESGVTGSEDIAGSALTDGQLSTPHQTPHIQPKLTMLYGFRARTSLNRGQILREPGDGDASVCVSMPPTVCNDTGHLQTPEEAGDLDF